MECSREKITYSLFHTTEQVSPPIPSVVLPRQSEYSRDEIVEEIKKLDAGIAVYKRELLHLGCKRNE